MVFSRAQDWPRGVFHPEGQLRTRWDLMLLILLIYIVISVPMVAFFDFKLHVAHTVADAIVDGVFMADVGLSFCTGASDVYCCMLSLTLYFAPG